MTATRIGTSPQRVGGADRVSGAQKYVADIHLPGVLHARLVTLDCRPRPDHRDRHQRRLSGSRASVSWSRRPTSRSPCRGSAPSSRIARSSRSARRSTTASRSQRWPPTRRMRPRRPPASSGWSTRSSPPSSRSRRPSTRRRRSCRIRRCVRTTRWPGPTSCAEHRVGWGDVDAVPADLVVENTYTFPMVTHFAIEPHAFIAAPDGDGIAVWSSIQHPNWLQKILAKVLGMPLSRVRVYAPDPGGGFGGKQHTKYEPLVAFDGAPGRSAGAPRPDPRGDVPGRAACGRRGPRPDRAAVATARWRSRTSTPDYLHRRLRRHRRPRRRQGQLRRGGAVPHAGRPDRRPRASSRTPCRRPPSAASATRR